ncbi:MAG: lipoate-protein ligase B, partial [Actinobacteria bacterium]|nr:lipoate-protein ligase B [Actinomycetota bacterium]
MVDDLLVAWLGQVPYRDALATQERLRAARQAGGLPDILLLLEHPPVYTKGRRTEPADLPMGEDWYRRQGIEVCESDRGGRVTYHGPGQLVG